MANPVKPFIPGSSIFKKKLDEKKPEEMKKEVDKKYEEGKKEAEEKKEEKKKVDPPKPKPQAEAPSTGTGYGAQHVEVAKSVAAAEPTEENKKNAAEAEKAYGTTGPTSSPVAAKQQEEKPVDLVDPEPEVSKAATEEIANKYGLGPEVTKDEAALKEVAESGLADEVKNEIKKEVTQADGTPYPETAILPSDDPASALDWFQKWSPLLTTLSVAVTAVGLANGVMIPPINFNKLSNRDEAYNAYLSILEEDQKTKNADTNTIASPMQAYETEKAFDAEHGEGAYAEGAKTFGAATEAGNVALQEQAHEQNLEEQSIAHKYNMEGMDKQLEHDLSMLEKQAATNKDTADFLQQLENEKDVKVLDYIKTHGYSINDIAKLHKAGAGRTAADTVREYIEMTGDVATDVGGMFLP